MAVFGKKKSGKGDSPAKLNDIQIEEPSSGAEGGGGGSYSGNETYSEKKVLQEGLVKEPVAN